MKHPTFDQYMALGLDTGLLNLAPGELSDPYFCYPVGAEPIGFEGCILYCFVPGYGDMVFASNPETCADAHVYPLARNFRDFLRLVLACSSVNPVEQIVWMDRARFTQHVEETRANCTPEQQAVLDRLAEVFALTPMEDPYAYVRQVQAEFDGSRIRYSAEYYDVLGLEPVQPAPEVSQAFCFTHTLEFETRAGDAGEAERKTAPADVEFCADCDILETKNR